MKQFDFFSIHLFHTSSSNPPPPPHPLPSFSLPLFSSTFIYNPHSPLTSPPPPPAPRSYLPAAITPHRPGGPQTTGLRFPAQRINQAAGRARRLLLPTPTIPAQATDRMPSYLTTTTTTTTTTRVQQTDRLLDGPATSPEGPTKRWTTVMSGSR